MAFKMQIIGRLTKDFELKYTPSGTAIAEASVATTKKRKDKATGNVTEKTTFLDVKMFGKIAETANQYLHKGDMVCMYGEYQSDKWQAQDGTNRYSHYCAVTEMEFINCKKDGQGNNGGGNYQQQNNYQQQTAPQQNNPYQQQNSQNIPTIDVDSEDIPF